MVHETNLFEVQVYGLIVNKHKEVLFVESASGLRKFMFPGGTLEPNESVLDCLKREIKEETNLRIKIIKPIYADTIYSKKVPQLGLIYFCTAPRGHLLLSKEHSAYEWANLQNLNALELAHPQLKKIAKIYLMMNR